MSKVIMIGYGDVETGGLDPSVCEVLDFSLRLCRPTLELPEVAQYHTGVMQVDNRANVQQSALDVNKITPEQIEAGRDPKAVLEEFEEWLNQNIDGPFSLMGHNVQFDHGFLVSWFVRHGYKHLASRMHYRMIDAQSIAWARLVATGAVKSAALGAVTGYFGIEHAAHTAKGDTGAGLEAVRRLIAPMEGVAETEKHAGLVT